MSNLSDALDRLVLMQKAVVPGSDAVPVSFYAQEGTPYWKNTVTSFAVEEVSETLQVIRYQIIMTLVLATITEGFNQEAEQSLQTWIPTILLYFGQRRQLKRTSADAPLPNLYPQGSLITSGQVRDNLQNSGIGQLMFGLDFQIEVPLWQETDQLIF